MPTYSSTYRSFNVYLINISHQQTHPTEDATTSDGKWAFFVETDEDSHMGSIHQITGSPILGIYNYQGPQTGPSLEDESVQRKWKVGELLEFNLELFEKVVEGTPLNHYVLEQDVRVWIMDVWRELIKWGVLLEYTFVGEDWDWSKVQTAIEEEIYS